MLEYHTLVFLVESLLQVKKPSITTNLSHIPQYTMSIPSFSDVLFGTTKLGKEHFIHSNGLYIRYHFFRVPDTFVDGQTFTSGTSEVARVSTVGVDVESTYLPASHMTSTPIALSCQSECKESCEVSYDAVVIDEVNDEVDHVDALSSKEDEPLLGDVAATSTDNWSTTDEWAADREHVVVQNRTLLRDWCGFKASQYSSSCPISSANTSPSIVSQQPFVQLPVKGCLTMQAYKMRFPIVNMFSVHEIPGSGTALLAFCGVQGQVAADLYSTAQSATPSPSSDAHGFTGFPFFHTTASSQSDENTTTTDINNTDDTTEKAEHVTLEPCTLTTNLTCVAQWNPQLQSYVITGKLDMMKACFTPNNGFDNFGILISLFMSDIEVVIASSSGLTLRFLRDLHVLDNFVELGRTYPCAPFICDDSITLSSTTNSQELAQTDGSELV